MSEQLSKFQKISTFVFDVDGVLTDGSVLITEDGQLLRNMYIKDGFALQLAIKSGYRVLIITGGKSEGIITRFAGLGITDVFLGVSDKMSVFHKYMKDHGIEPESCLYMGDDVPDLQVMREAGISCCPSDASVDILSTCDYISPHAGGRGCVRDVIEKTMRIQSKWFPDRQGSW